MTAHVPVLNYHKVAEIPPAARHPENYVRPRQFAAQLKLLRVAGFESVTMSQYVAYRKGQGTLPPRPVMITFDDGYRSNRNIAFPLMREHGLTATVFIVSGLVGGTNRWDPGDMQEPLLDLHDLRELQTEGIEFQSHTRTHPRLTEIPPRQALLELTESRDELAQMLGAPVEVVAYPWARHDPSVEKLAEDAGYLAGATLRRRVNFDDTPLFALRRIGVAHTTSITRFGWDLFRLRWRGE